MSKSGLNTPITYNGQVTTINELDRRGLIAYSKTDNWAVRGKDCGPGRSRTAYFADLNNGLGSWEITKTAYELRGALPLRPPQ